MISSLLYATKQVISIFRMILLSKGYNERFSLAKIFDMALICCTWFAYSNVVMIL